LSVKYDQEPHEDIMVNIVAVVKGPLVAAISHPYSIVTCGPLLESDDCILHAAVLKVYDTRQKGKSLEVFSVPLSPVKLLDNDDNKSEETWDHTFALNLTADGKYVAAGYDKVELWNIDDGSSTVFNLTDDDSRTAISCLAISLDGSRLAAGGYGGTVYVWHLMHQDSKDWKRQRFQCGDSATVINTILFSCTDKNQMIVRLKKGPICILELDNDRRSTADVPPDARLVSFASSDWAAYNCGDDFGFFESKAWDICKMKLTNHVQYRTQIIEQPISQIFLGEICIVLEFLLMEGLQSLQMGSSYQFGMFKPINSWDIWLDIQISFWPLMFTS
jgi:WD40 repeat protein